MTDAAVAYTYTPTSNASILGTPPADTLITLMCAMLAFYRNAGAWIMNGNTLAAIRKLKDANGAFVWQPSYPAGQPETILGRPVIEAPDMDDVGSAAEPIVFGDFARGYRIYDRLQLSVMRDPYSQATSGLVRFHARRRIGGGVVLVLNTGAIVSAGDFTAKLQVSDTTTSGDFTDVAATDLVGMLPATLEAASVYRQSYIANKRYVRTVLTKNCGTSIAAGAVIVMGHAHEQPVT